MAEFSAPSKVFLLGEYAALAGAPALVAAVAPRFRLRTGGSAAIFHPESPAGKLLARAGRALGATFEDPRDGLGGLGASTAQFALLYLALAESAGWEQGWQAAHGLYRELTADAELPPSGADLVAQWQGGVTLFSGEEKQAEDLGRSFPWSRVLVFSATAQPGRKVATHRHLRDMAGSALPLQALRAPLREGIRAARAGDPVAFGAALTRYAHALAEHGLESAAAAADRSALSGVPGVLGAKGSGALLSDAVIVVTTEGAEAEVVRAAADRGLSLLGPVPGDQSGVLCGS